MKDPRTIAVPATSGQGQGWRSLWRHLLPREIAALIGIAALIALFSVAVLEVQTGATAYIIGEGHWSKAQQDAANWLHRYAGSGDARQLASARNELGVMLGDRRARLALESDPVDVASARAGFLAGRNSERDVDRMIRLYRYLRRAPYIQDAVATWRTAEIDVLELERLGTEMEQAWAAGPLTPEQVAGFQQRIIDADLRVRPLEIAFSRSLAEGTRILRSVLVAISLLVLALLIWTVLHVLRTSLARVRESEGSFRAAFHQTALGMLKMEPDGTIREANEAIARILGREPAQLNGSNLFELFHGHAPAALGASAPAAIDWTAHMAPVEQRFVRDDGQARWLRWSVAVIEAEGAIATRVFALIEDVSEARRLADEMAYQASHDTLTGLINRREIERRLRRGIAGARELDEQHAFLFLDLDQFKLINDTCGHAAGDRFLCQISSTLMVQMRGNDWLGRLGGDEFAVLLENTTVEEAVRIAQRLRRSVAALAFQWEGRRFQVTCSVGIVGVGRDNADVGHVMQAADRACYLAKEQGRDCIRVYHESDQALARVREQLERIADIRLAIAENRIRPYAQRIEALDGRGGLHYEVLARLVDEHGNVHTPDSFLPAAERFGEATAIDRQVVSLALRELEKHPEHVRELELCHLNISAQSIANPDFRSEIGALLDASPVPARKLCFELTETAAIGNIAHAREFIDDMRARGCRIALDDFGSGLSSFAYLKTLPVDVLKIDGIFIHDLANNEVDPILVRSMCEVARSLGITTVAEWVEDQRLLQRLRALGVDQAQGFGIHAPCDLAELIASHAATTRTAAGA